MIYIYIMDSIRFFSLYGWSECEESVVALFGARNKDTRKELS